MTKVRDEAISDWEMILDGRMKGDLADRIRNSLVKCDKGELLTVIPEIVDTTLFHLLRWFEEQDEFEIMARLKSGSSTNLAQESDGLAGELFSEKGWIQKYSEKRG